MRINGLQYITIDGPDGKLLEIHLMQIYLLFLLVMVGGGAGAYNLLFTCILSFEIIHLIRSFLRTFSVTFYSMHA